MTRRTHLPRILVLVFILVTGVVVAVSLHRPDGVPFRVFVVDADGPTCAS